VTSTPHVPNVDVHETHTGVVVLAGDRAFKAKKPLLTDFLDFRTPEQRERACLREVELNSRLSPSRAPHRPPRWASRTDRRDAALPRR
jgi:uncharacterized protein